MTINGKNFYDQPVDSDIKKKYKEIRKLTTGPGEDYTIRLWLSKKSLEINSSWFK